MNNSARSFKTDKNEEVPQSSDKVRAAAEADLERLSQSSLTKKKAAPRTLKPLQKVDPYSKPRVEGQKNAPPRKPGLSGQPTSGMVGLTGMSHVVDLDVAGSLGYSKAKIAKNAQQHEKKEILKGIDHDVMKFMNDFKSTTKEALEA